MSVPGELRVSRMSRSQMPLRSRSMAITLAPSASSVRRGPMAEPAPRSTKYCWGVGGAWLGWGQAPAEGKGDGRQSFPHSCMHRALS